MKPHYRLHCKFVPFIPREGLLMLMWRVGEYGAWFNVCWEAVKAARNSTLVGDKGEMR